MGWVHLAFDSIQFLFLIHLSTDRTRYRGVKLFSFYSGNIPYVPHKSDHLDACLAGSNHCHNSGRDNESVCKYVFSNSNPNSQRNPTNETVRRC